ncbi:MAG: DUF1275 domain-containing protein [Bacteroidaceae bacterium]|nr:DUF1275 domain-containing protein [Bacteroidaceae bacterium]
MAESVIMALLLALVGGFLDAYTYVLRGGVFATMQTGNMILLVINGFNLNWTKCFSYLIPLLVFAVGSVLSEIIKDVFKKNKVGWRQTSLIVEVLMLIGTIFIPFGSASIYANCLISFVAAIQVNGFNRMRGHTFFTTMCTGNLRTGSLFLYKGIRKKETELLIKSLRYFAVIIFFMLGVLIGISLFESMKQFSILIPCAILIVCYFILYIKVDVPDSTKNNE